MRVAYTLLTFSLIQVVTTLYFGIDTGLMAAIVLNVVSYVYRSGNTVSISLLKICILQSFWRVEVLAIVLSVARLFGLRFALGV